MNLVVGILAACSSPLFSAGFPDHPSVYVHYSVDNPANLVTPPLNQTFVAGNVDIVNAKLVLPNLGFQAIPYPHGLGAAAPVYFSTTGTLPEPLIADTPYYIAPASGGGYKVYPEAVDADAPFQPGSVLGEKILLAQNLAQGVLSLAFTSGGSGTHTLYTLPLLSQMTDMTTNGYHSTTLGAADKQRFLELDTDSKGSKFIRTSGANMRENLVGSYNAYGQTFFQTPSTKAFEARQKVGGKRVVYQIYVGKVRSFKERQVVRFLTDSTKVFPLIDQIKYPNHRMNTGDLINVKTYPGSALPVPLAANTDYYARKIDANNITLHPTSLDAKNNTGAIDLTTSGSGSLLFWNPERVGDSRRWSFFAEVLAPNSGGNTLSARLQEPLPTPASIVKISTAFAVSGTNNGNIAGFATVPNLTPVVLWAPPRAVLPSPLQAGVRYWTTKTPGSSTNGRLHATLASAQASVGIATSLSSCIKYTAAGKGEMLTSQDDDASAIAFGTLSSALEPFATRVPLGPLSVFVFKIDFNDPAQPTVFAKLGVNQAVTEQKLLNIPKGLTPLAVNDKAKAWSLFNSAQGHVPIDMDYYEAVFGSSTDSVADSEIQTMVDYFKSKYQIP